MELLFPGFLWALAALAIPIIIHLFYFRRYKKVLFSNVKFLQEIKEETSSRSKLRNLLVLLARLLALACLVLAFVQPILGKREASSAHQSVGIFVDNSFSMDARRDDVPLIDIAKQHARDIVMAHGEGDEFQVLTQDLEGRHQRYYNRDQALDLIDEITTSPKSNSLAKIVNRHYQLAAKSDDDASVYVLSDFQQNTAREDIVPDTSVNLNFVPFKGVSPSNISIDTVYLETIVPSTSTPTDMVVKVSNHSDQRVEGVRLSSTYEGIQRPEGLYDIGALSSVYDTISMVLRRSGVHKIKLEVNDFPVVYDNSYYVTIRVPEDQKVRVLYERGASASIGRMGNILNNFSISQESTRNIDYNSLQLQDLIVLKDVSTVSSGLVEQLSTYVRNGGNLLIFPPSNNALQQLNALLRRLGVDTYKEQIKLPAEVKGLNTSEYIFSDVYERKNKDAALPKVSLHYSLTQSQRSRKDALMTYRDGSSFLNKYTIGDGRVYLSTAPMDVAHNDLTKIGEVFVPMIVKMSMARNKPQRIAHTVGTRLPISIEIPSDASDQLVKLVNEKEIIPGQQISGSYAILDVRDQIKEEGFYDANVGEKNLDVIAYNYDRKESDMKYMGSVELDSLASRYGATVIDNSLSTDFTTIVKEKSTGRAIWPYLVLGALLFLLLETLLLKFWKPN